MRRGIRISRHADGRTQITDAKTGEELEGWADPVVMFQAAGAVGTYSIDLLTPSGFEVEGEVEWPDEPALPLKPVEWRPMAAARKDGGLVVVRLQRPLSTRGWRDRSTGVMLGWDPLDDERLIVEARYAPISGVWCAGGSYRGCDLNPFGYFRALPKSNQPTGWVPPREYQRV